ncbi:MAG TPA: inositol monophosphatase family protein [Thermodesulfobacteriota bacterium]|nr:inositol monophosphatase family protein [Thermodesulfobacteriota bacterium]
MSLSYLEVAEYAAREAGKLLKGHLGKVKSIEYKAKNSLVTEVDKLSENLIVKIIRSYFPSHDVFAEEGGRGKRQSSYLWIIDPLDGTTNYTHTYPVFSISIALEVEGIIRLGIVYDPMREEFFYSELGGGSYLNGQIIKVSQTETVEESLLDTGFTHEHEWMVEENLIHFANFIRRARAVRRDGSAALDLCYVACGRFDGFWELGLNPWDTAAGYLIVKEAGGKVTDFSGNEFDVYGEEILATNGIVHEEMIRVLSLGRGERV